MLSLFIFLKLISGTVFAQQFSYDLGISGGDIYFNKNVLIAGDKVRLYARVKNYGKEDVSAYVRFFAGQSFVGDSQNVSIVAGGYPDEVYVDWVVPKTDFNIRAELKGLNPEDENPSNNVALTQLFVPKTDNDLDGLTDDIDLDDDNDNLLDSEEINLGTDKNDPDTDSDGVLDGADDYPLDPSRSKTEKVQLVQPEAAQPTTTQTSKSQSTTDNFTKPQAVNTSTTTESSQKTDTVVEDVAAEPEPVKTEETNTEKQISDARSILVDVEKVGWRSFIFEPEIRGFTSQNLEYRWEFGDGTTSDRRAPKHTYFSPGSYEVTLTVTDRALGKIYRSQDLNIEISFFNVSNYQLWVVLGVVIVGLAVVLKIIKTILLRKVNDD